MEVSCEISPVNLPDKSFLYLLHREISWQDLKTIILVGGIQRDICSKLTIQIFPVDMAQREIVGSVLRLIF